VQSQHLVKNRILRQLSADELKSVQPWLSPMDLRSNVVLHEPGQPIERVYFPLSGMISLLAVMQSGEAIETGIVGSDGWSEVTPPSMDMYSGRGQSNWMALL
jgi:CRP-like cAMP-binding protein